MVLIQSTLCLSEIFMLHSWFLLIPSLFSGAIITEQVFDLPGIGNVALGAMNRGDIPFIMGYNMFLAVLSVLGVLLADLMYGVVDPRVKLE